VCPTAAAIQRALAADPQPPVQAAATIPPSSHAEIPLPL
jgi:hypothetical protein